MAAPNSYGFDFLRSEHTQSGSGPAPDDSDVNSQTTSSQADSPTGAAAAAAADAGDKTDLEKQFDVIHFLQTHRSSGCLTPAAIFRATGVDLSEGGEDENVAKMLVRNPKIRTEDTPNPDYDPAAALDDADGDDDDADGGAAGTMRRKRMIVTYGYQAKFNIHDRAGLLAQINRCKDGVPARDLSDAYDGVEDDLTALITGGDIVAVSNPEDRDRTLFPRGEPFLVEIEGNVSLPGDDGGQSGAPEKDGGEEKKDGGGNDEEVQRARREALERQHQSGGRECFLVKTEADARDQLRRGEAVWVGGQWFRVSSAVREGVPLSEQPARAQAPPSVTLRRDLSKKNEVDGYIRPYDRDLLPLDSALSAAAVENLKSAGGARERLESLGITSLSGRGGPGGASAMLHRKRAAVRGHVSASSSAAHHPVSMAHRRQDRATAEAAREAAADPALHYCHARRHGCTTDIKGMYLETGAKVPESEVDLYKMLVAAKLVEEGEAMRRPKMKVKRPGPGEGPNGKPKKRRYYQRKNQRITNVHLEGTEIGLALQRAAEKQRLGKEVGDGGM